MSNPITNYSTLTSALVDLFEDESSEFREYMPIAIDNAQNKIAREIDHEIHIYSSTISLASSTATLTKPNGHKITHAVTFIDSNSRNIPLDKKDESYLDEYWPHSTSVGIPRYYADVDYTTLKITPCTSATGSIKIKGERKPSTITSANPTNVYTSVVPDLLYFATALEMAAWSRNNEVLTTIGQLYIATRDAITIEAIRARRATGSNFYFEAPNTISMATRTPN